MKKRGQENKPSTSNITVQRNTLLVFTNLEEKKVQNPNQETKLLVQNQQNVHHAIFEASVKDSFKKLKVRYSNLDVKMLNASLDEISKMLNASLSEVSAYLDSQKEMNLKKRKDIKNAIEQIEENPDFCPSACVPHSLRYLFILVWAAVNDQTVVENMYGITGSANIVNLRKESLLNQLYDNTNAYSNGGASCLQGVANRIITALSRYHPDVSTILTTEDYNNEASKTAKQFLLEKLKSLSLKKQMQIMATTEEKEGEANRFLKTYEEELKKKLEEQFGGRAGQSYLDGLVKESHSLLPSWPDSTELPTLTEFDACKDSYQSAVGKAFKVQLNNLMDQENIQLDAKNLTSLVRVAFWIKKLDDALIALERVQPPLSLTGELSALLTKGLTQHKLTGPQDYTLMNVHAILQEKLRQFEENSKNYQKYKRQLLPDAWEKRYAVLKNLFMIFTPIVGWGVFACRGFTFYPIPTPKVSEYAINIEENLEKDEKGVSSSQGKIQLLLN